MQFKPYVVEAGKVAEKKKEEGGMPTKDEVENLGAAADPATIEPDEPVVKPTTKRQ